MMAVNTSDDLNTYQAEFLRLQREWSRGPQAWLLPTRKAAMACFGELGFPTTGDEAWRFTSLAPVTRTVFTLSEGDAEEVSPRRLRPFMLADAACRLVFVNGRYVPDLSDVAGLTSGVTVRSLAEAVDREVPAVRAHLGRYAAWQTHAFVALSTAFMTDGAFVHIPEGWSVDGPIHLLFVSTAGYQPTVSYPRCLIIAEAASQATIVESYAGLDGNVYLTNAVTELVAGPDAVIDHYRHQQESDQAYHVGVIQVGQERDSRVTMHSLALGAALARNEVDVVLDGQGAECTLNGLSVLGDAQHVDNHLRVEHARPHCNSREYYKNVLADQSRAVFTGRIVVLQDAQKTDAKQTNMNLLLSDEAKVNSRPQLEIFADDVKCTHGATIGQLDDDAIFYLRSRGISEPDARALLIQAFAGEMIDRVRIDSLRARVAEHLWHRLPHGDLTRETP